MELIRVAAYCRVSTESDMQAGSFESQKRYFEEYIARKENYILQGIYADYGISGTSVEKRDEFNRMIRDAKDGKIDLILTKEVSRFARNTLDSLRITRELREINVGVGFTNDGINTLDGDGELRLSIMSSMAQDESRKTSERVKWGMRRGMEQGKVYTPPIIGYDLKQGELVVNNTEAEIIKTIFRLYAYEQRGASSIARYLAERAIAPPKRIKSWSGTTITRILKNEKYCGDLVQGKTTVKDYLTHKSVKVADEKDCVIIKNHHEAIVDRETWKIVQEKLSKASNGSGLLRRTSNSYWCTGLIRCGYCNKYYTVHSKKLKKGHFVAWRCIETVKHGRKKENASGQTIGCNNKQINNIALEECMKFAIKIMAVEADNLKEEFIEKIYKMNKELKNKRKDKEKYTEKINGNKIKQDKLINLYYEDRVSKDEFSERKKELDKELEIIKNELKMLEEKIKRENDGVITTDRITKRITDIIKNYEYNNKVYERIVDKIIVFENVLHIYFKGVEGPVKLSFSTKGREGNYKVECEEIREQ